MAEQAIHEMVAAYAVGCMDKQNFVQFKDYMNEGGDLPPGELGELQNLVSMVPVILDLEKPQDSIKDMVATQLIGMKEEIKAKILKDRKTLVSTFTSGETIATMPDSNLTKPIASTRITPKFDTFDLNTTPKEPESTFDASKDEFDSTFGEIDLFRNTTVKVPTEQISKNTLEEKPEKLNTSVTETKPTTTSIKKEEAPIIEPQKPTSNWIQIIGIIFTIFICTILGYYTFISTQRLENRIDELQTEVKSIKNQLTTANSFVGSNASLVEFLNYKDINIINMINADPAQKATAKILLSFNQKEGLIQFKNFTRLQTDQSFQLWAVSKGQHYSCGTYQPANGEYMRITSFPFLPKEQIDSYQITIESANGASTPSANLVFVSESLAGQRNK